MTFAAGLATVPACRSIGAGGILLLQFRDHRMAELHHDRSKHQKRRGTENYLNDNDDGKCVRKPFYQRGINPSAQKSGQIAK